MLIALTPLKISQFFNDLDILGHFGIPEVGGKKVFWQLRDLDRCRNDNENAEVVHFYIMAGACFRMFWTTHHVFTNFDV